MTDSIGTRIQRGRKMIGMTQENLAEACDMSANAISLYERGLSEPKLSCLCRIAAALDVKYTALIPPDFGDGIK